MSYLNLMTQGEQNKLLNQLVQSRLGGQDAQMFLRSLHGMRDFWTFSVINGDGVPVGGAMGQTFDKTGTVVYYQENGQSLAYFDASSWLSNGSTLLRVYGNESWLPSHLQGVTVGCWAKFNTTTGSQRLISRWKTAGNFSYLLHKPSGGQAALNISNNGTNNSSILNGVVMAAGEWYHIVGRYQPAVRFSVSVDGRWAHAATAYTSLYTASTTPTYLGNDDDTATALNGFMAFPFIVGAVLDDTTLSLIRLMTKPI